MKMTIVEALAIPKGMTFEEYGKLLEEKKKLEAKCRRLSNKIFDEEDSLEVLADEVGSELYNKHFQSKRKAEVKREKLQAELSEIMKKLRRGE